MKAIESYTKYFLAHREVTLELVKKIGQENYSYQPTPTSMTAEKLVAHMAVSFYSFVSVVKSGDASSLSQSKNRTESNLYDFAKDLTKQTVEIIQSLTEVELNTIIDLTDSLGIKVKGSRLLQIAMDHEIHHKGSLFVYVREMGHTDLPMFVSKG